MNVVERMLDDELTRLMDRLAASVPEGCLEAINHEKPAVRQRLDEADARVAAARATLLEHYGRWLRALEDVENLWALAAWRSATAEESAEHAPSLAA